MIMVDKGIQGHFTDTVHMPVCRCKIHPFLAAVTARRTVKVSINTCLLYTSLSKERLETLQKELAELRDTFNTQKAQWDNEKHSVEKLQKGTSSEQSALYNIPLPFSPGSIMR